VRPWWGPGETGARGSGRAARLPDCGRAGWRRARRLRGARAAEVGEEGPHDGGVLHDGDDPQPTASTMGETIFYSPPLVITEQHIDRVLEITRASIKAAVPS
jgi:hypothetical protein